MRPYQTLVDLARQQRWSFVGRSHYEYQITIARRDREVRLTAVPTMDGGHELEVRVELPPPGLPKFHIKSVDHVDSPEPDELPHLWPTERSQFVKERFPDLTAHATHDRLTVETHDVRDPTIIAALELALDLAHANVYGFAALRAIPEAVVKQTDGPHVELAGPAPITIRPVRHHGRVFTKAAMQCALPDPPPSTSALGNATLGQEGNLLTLSWPGIEVDPYHLQAAVELLRMLSSGPHDGAYR